ncbi:MAG TPA: carboxypeptidase regulatory-like domain-containing protein [Vicinamibacterales bacterium]|nr:carboxypeptidase regulatory-like domain-containing protein [Vicinamibacterales bacterium]
MTRMLIRFLVVVAILAAGPSVATAQSLAGTVRDTSGAVLPGVTIEASSPALITKVRTGVTDETGQYRIPDLPPGTYKVTFTLTGFTTVVREGVELSGGGVMTIGAEMRVGSLQESITVTGESPVVDVQTARQQTVIDGDIVRALPASRSYGNYIAAIPAIQATGFGGGATTINNFFSARGGRNTEGLIQLDGMNVGAPGNGGGVSGYLYDMSNSSEVQVAISGGLGEADRGGPAFNIIPKTGGNTFSGTGFTSYAGKWGQSSNIDQHLKDLGFGEQAALIKSYDSNIAVGGPILRDRVWFYGNARAIGTYQEQQNLYVNANAGDPNAWTWVKATSPSVRNSTSKTLDAVRLTWQATQKNKFGFYIDYTKNCSAGAYTEGGDQCRGPGKDWIATGPGVTPGTATVSPESGSIWDAPAKIMQGSWTSPFSNHVLFESGYSAFYTDNGDPRPYGVLTDFIPVTEQSTGAGVPFANFIYRGFNPAPSSNQKHATWKAAMSYVSGSHNMKWGYQAGYMNGKNTTWVGRQISYRFNNGLPNQLSQRVGTNETSNSLLYNGAYIQDQWTRKRLTLQGALRFETASSWAPSGENGIITHNEFGGPFLLPRTDGVHGYKDITPRMGAAYDVFGDGRTALKVNVAEYLQGAWTGDAYTISNAGSTLVTTVNRSWSDPNGDRIAQCDFMNSASNGECGAWSALNWGSFNQTTTVNPAVLTGWGTRNRDWQYGVSVQQQIATQIAVEVSYNRRNWTNFFITHNRALTAADYDEVTLTAPVDSRLPNGGGYPVTFLTRNTRSALGATDSYYTTSADYGDETHYWHGVDLSLSARTRWGLTVQGGTSTGRGVNDTCDMLAGRFGREMAPTLGTAAVPIIAVGIVDGVKACDATEPWLTSARGLGSYTVPKVDVMVSAIFRSQPNAQPGADVGTNGASRTATYRMNATQFQAATGRPLATGLAQQDVNLLLPGTLYGDRINAIDMRFAKVLRFGKYKTNVGLDIYNLTNANTPTTYETVYDPATNGARWMQPTAVLLPRFMRFNVQVDF